jgi:hypothetical protein
MQRIQNILAQEEFDETVDGEFPCRVDSKGTSAARPQDLRFFDESADIKRCIRHRCRFGFSSSLKSAFDHIHSSNCSAITIGAVVIYTASDGSFRKQLLSV